MSKVINLEEKRKKILKKKIFIYTMLGIIGIYILSAIYLIIKTPSDTVIVEKGIITHEASTVGYIIRNEKVVKGEKYKNRMYQIASEGERVAKNQSVFRYSGDDEQNLQKKIGDINIKIQEALEKEKTSFPLDIKNLNNKIEKELRNLTTITDIEQILETKKNIDNLISKKAKISGETSVKGTYIKKLINEKEKYEKKLEKGSETVNAPMSGIVSYKVDGLENILTTDDFSNLTIDTLEGLNLKTGKIISASEESAKIIDNFECYITIIVENEKRRSLFWLHLDCYMRKKMIRVSYFR